jgi:hypothetical protein
MGGFFLPVFVRFCPFLPVAKGGYEARQVLVISYLLQADGLKNPG